MTSRQLSVLDRLIVGLDNALRTVTPPAGRPARQNPAADIEDAELGEADRRHAAGLMRVNHAGEVAAQGLYQGHALVARDTATREQMLAAAAEEIDHLGWCEQRLAELGSTPSRLGPLWYGGAFAIGAVSGVLGDKWSLGFVEETERQVAAHLDGHLRKLPAGDRRSRAIVTRMREEEEAHGAAARAAGAAALPRVVRDIMRLSSKVMTESAYRL